MPDIEPNRFRRLRISSPAVLPDPCRW